MPRKESEAVRESKGPILQQEEFGSGQPTMEDAYRMMKEAFDRWDRKLDKISDKMKEYIEERTSIDQRLTRLEYGARQPRLAMEADGHANTKTRERTEGTPTAVQAMRGDSFSARWVEPGPKHLLDQFWSEGQTSRSSLQGRRFGRERRYVAQVVSPILGDALINSRWWLSSHRQNLHSGDHRQQATTTVVLDRGGGLEDGKLMDFNSIRLVRQQLLETALCSLLPEGR